MSASGDYVVTIAKYGPRQTVRSDVFLNYALYDQPDDPIGMDYFVWVVRNADRTVLVDTGFSPEGGAVRHRDQLIGLPELYAELGVAAVDAPPIVVTHAHYDHIGNLGLFPSSRVLIARREFEFWRGGLAGRPLFHHSVEDVELAALAARADAGGVDLFDGRHELAPGIEVIELGGHTPGQSIVKVATADGPVLLASDAVHYYEEYEAAMPFTSVADLVAMYTGFETIRALVESGEVRHLVAGHDPATLDRFTPVTGRLAGLAATIGAVA